MQIFYPHDRDKGKTRQRFFDEIILCQFRAGILFRYVGYWILQNETMLEKTFT